MTKARHPISIEKRNRILSVINAALSVVTIIAGVLVLAGLEVEYGLLAAYLGVCVASVVAIIQEINIIIARHDKRSLMVSLPCIILYVSIVIIPLLPISDRATDQAFLPFIISSASLYMAVRLGKVIYQTVLARPKRWILFVVLVGAILLLSVLYVTTNYARPLDVSYYIGVFLIFESLIIILMGLISNDSAIRFFQILVKTHAIGILVGLILFMLLSSVLLLAVEPEVKSFGDAMWHCFAVVTTIGFGDYYISSFTGRVVTVLLGVYGIVVVAVITSIIVSFYSDSLERERQERERLEKEKQETLEKEKGTAEIEEVSEEKETELAPENRHDEADGDKGLGQ